MTRIQNWINGQPIRNKVLVFGILMSTIPLVFLSWYYFIHTKIELEERINEKQSLVLSNLSSEIELEFNQTFQHLQMLTMINETAEKSTGFYELLEQSEMIEEIVMTSGTGQVKKRVSRYSLNLPKENEKWFTDEMWLKFQIEDEIYGNVEFNQFGQPVMKLAVPYKENGQRKGIGVTIQLQKIIGKISSQRQDNASYLYLLDENGRIIAHQDYSLLWRKNPIRGSKEVLGVFERIAGLNWTLVMEQPKVAAYGPINKMMRNGLTVVAIVILFVSLISVYAGLNFTKPIVLLDKEMNKLRSGTKINPVNIRQKDELGKLARSFNEMSSELLDKSRRIEQEKERLDVVLNGIGAGLALVTSDYKFTWMNPILKNLLSEEQLLLPCYSVMGGRDAPCTNCMITCPGTNGSGDRMISFRDSQGNERIYRHRVFPLNHAIDGEGEFLLFIEDVTEQREIEEKMAQTDKLAALGLMASGFAHEVNNPLTTINVYAEDLIDLMRVEPLEQAEMFLYLEKIKDNAIRCKKITGNMLNFSRKSNWDIDNIDINDLIQNSISLVDYALKKNSILVEVQVEENMPTFLGDRLKLMQVLVNLLNNSIDAIEGTGKIRITAALKEAQILLTVSDTGNGMAKEVLSQIFDPFYTTKPVGKGTGLGLSVCYGIIQQFGGTIHFQSEAGNGTIAEITIPAEIRVKEELK